MTDDPNAPMRERMTLYVKSLQQRIVASLEELDPHYKFFQDAWIRPEGGEGLSCVLSDSRKADPSNLLAPPSILEKAGVNISIVYGKLPPPAIAQMRANHASLPTSATTSLPFFVAGLSLVIHPRNPYAPTVHANYRYFEITSEQKDGEGPPEVLAWWFGGGSDLTPSYLFQEDAIHFHSTLKDACDLSGAQVYPAFKKWCDEYFYIPHRGESRGIGGIFFDDLSGEPHSRFPNAGPAERPYTQEEIFTFVKRCGESFLPSYLPILTKRMNSPYGDHQRRWQLVRRGRYVEFNLVIDRGTKFGLQTPGARIESVLMTMPETVRWEYRTDLGEEEGTPEADLMAMVRKTGGTVWLK